MQKSKESQELATMIAELESLDTGFDWVFEVGDDDADVVRNTYKDLAAAIIEDHAISIQRALAAIGPEGAAPMMLIVTPESIDLRPASAWTFLAPCDSRPTKSSWRRPDPDAGV